jgi:acetyl esterase/lipase
MVHGGGFMRGVKDGIANREFMAEMASRGMVGVSIQYRLNYFSRPEVTPDSPILD